MNDDYEQDGKGRPILAASSLKPGPAGKRSPSAEQRVSRPLTQLMEFLQQTGGSWQAGTKGEYGQKNRPTFDAAHLIAHDFGGDPTEKNLVPVEARVNKSFMGMKEGEIRDAVGKNANYYMVVRCVYNDPPAALAQQFSVDSMSEKNDKSQYRPATRVRFNLMALERVPDYVNVKVVDKGNADNVVYQDDFPTGGPLIDWIGETRAELQAAQDSRGEDILDPAKRAQVISQAKQQTIWPKTGP
jgi:hypothetical protein